MFQTRVHRTKTHSMIGMLEVTYHTTVRKLRSGHRNAVVGLALSMMQGMMLVVVFFVTSSDSGSLVIDTIAAGGKVNAPLPQRIFWASFEGLVAIALLLGGGLAALQAMAVSTGLPFTIVLLAACYAIIQGLRAEPKT